MDGKPSRVTIYGMAFKDEPTKSLHLAFQPHQPGTSMTIERSGQIIAYPGESFSEWVVDTPSGSTLKPDERNPVELLWTFGKKEVHSSASEVWSLAKLGLHGFRFLPESPLSKRQ
jgi:hypothetical protein